MNRMPVVFVGHGSPMNAINENKYTQEWRRLSERIPRPKAILSVSAHWYTRGSYLTGQENPPQIYDFYGFPKEMYELKYEVQGSKNLVDRVKELIPEAISVEEHGIDHGTWCPLRYIYPEADVPVVQLSVDGLAGPAGAIELGKKLAPLRDEGYLIMGSGNVVHSFKELSWDLKICYDWAYDFDARIKLAIESGRTKDLINYSELGEGGKRAFHTEEHYLPLLYAMGATDSEDSVEVFSKSCEMGSMSMTSYLWGSDK